MKPTGQLGFFLKKTQFFKTLHDTHDFTGHLAHKALSDLSST